MSEALAAAVPSAVPVNPFQFLRPFGENDSALLRGRDREISDAVAGITSAPTYVLYGRPGVGKTSLLRAGVFPALRQLSYRPIHIRTSKNPLSDVNRALADPDLLGLTPAADVSHRLRELIAKNPLVLVFDQFEEIYEQLTPQQRHDLLRELAGWTRCPTLGSRLRLVFCVREEKLAPLLNEFKEHFSAASNPPVCLNPLSPFAARVAMERPLVQKGIAYDRDLVSRVLDALAGISRIDGGFDPLLLQIVCTELFQEAAGRQRKDPAVPLRLLSADLDQIGALEGVFRRILDRAFGVFAEGPQLLLACLILDVLSARRIDKKSLTRQELLNHPEFQASEQEIDAVLTKFESAGLIRSETVVENRRYELVHDRLTEFVLPRLKAQESFFCFRTARQSVVTAVSLDLWRQLGDNLVSTQVLTDWLGAHREILRLDPAQLEVVFWSAIYHQHPDLSYWSARLGDAETPRRMILDFLQPKSPSVAPFDDYTDADRVKMTVGALAWCALQESGQPEIVAVCRRIAEDRTASEPVRHAAAKAFAQLATDDQKCKLAQLLDPAPTNFRSAVRRLGDWRRNWQRHDGLKIADAHAVAADTNHVRDDFLAEVFGPQTAPLTLETAAPWTWQLIQESLGRRPMHLGVPALDLQALRTRYEQKKLQGQSEIIRKRREVGAAVGVASATVFAISWGTILAIGLCWILGKIDPDIWIVNVSPSFFLSTLCLGWIGALAFGYFFGDSVAKAAAQEALIHGEGRWFWAVRRPKRHWFLVYLILNFILGLSIYLTIGRFSLDYAWNTSLITAALLIPIFLALAGMVHACRFFLAEYFLQSPRQSIVQRYLKALVACAGLSNFICLGLYLLTFVWMRWVPESEDFSVTNKDRRLESIAWTACSFLGVFLCAAVFILVNALDFSTRIRPVETKLTPLQNPRRRFALHALFCLASLTAFLAFYRPDTYPIFAEVIDFTNPRVQPIKGKNEGFHDQDYFRIDVADPMGRLVECKALENSKDTHILYIDNDRAKFERQDGQLYFLPEGKHLVHVAQNQDQSSEGEYMYSAQAHAPVASGVIELSKTAAAAGGYAWCMCKRPTADNDNKYWSGSLQIKLRELSASPGYLVVQVAKDFFVRKGSERFALSAEELQENFSYQKSENQPEKRPEKPFETSARWHVDLNESGGKPPISISKDEMPTATARIDLSGNDQVKRIVTFSDEKPEATLKFTVRTTDKGDTSAKSDVLLLVRITYHESLTPGIYVGSITSRDQFARSTRRDPSIYGDLRKVDLDAENHYLFTWKAKAANAATSFLRVENGNGFYLHNELFGVKGKQETPTWRTLKTPQRTEDFASLFFPPKSGSYTVCVEASLKHTEEANYSIDCYQAKRLNPIRSPIRKDFGDAGQGRICTSKQIKSAKYAFSCEKDQRHLFLTTTSHASAKVLCASRNMIFALTIKPLGSSGKFYVEWASDFEDSCELYLVPHAATEVNSIVLEHYRTGRDVETIESPTNRLNANGINRRDSRINEIGKINSSGKYEGSYLWKMRKSNIYLVEMRSTDIDSFLFLRDTTRNSAFAVDDDSGENLNARILFVPMEDKEVQVVATSFSPAEKGAFTLIAATYVPPTKPEHLKVEMQSTPIWYSDAYSWGKGRRLLILGDRVNYLFDDEKIPPWDEKRDGIRFMPPICNLNLVLVPDLSHDQQGSSLYELTQKLVLDGTIQIGSEAKAKYRELSGAGHEVTLKLADDTTSAKLRFDGDLKSIRARNYDSIDLNKNRESDGSIGLPVIGPPGLYRIRVSNVTPENSEN